jgi:hypothetical protein
MLGLVLAFAVSGGFACGAATRQQQMAQERLIGFLKQELGGNQFPEWEKAAGQATHLQVAWKDLNGDGKPEALVYVSGRAWCGSGGCRLFVCEQVSDNFRIRAETTITRLPVAVLAHRSNGWRDIVVTVAGGGIIPGYRAVLPFDGKRYAPNPSVPPAYRVRDGASEEVLLPADIYPFL